MRKIKNWIDWNCKFLFYSPSQKKVAGSNYGINLFTGQKVEYTEMRSLKYLFNGGKWGDYKFVGFGRFEGVCSHGLMHSGRVLL